MGTHIYNNIKMLRLFRGYSQEDFATQLQLSTAYYGKIERGELDIKLSKLLQIFKALNAKPEVIFGSIISFPNFKE